MGRGLDRERRLRDVLGEDGWVALRVAKGPVDVVALRPGEVRLIQCKSTAGGPWERFGPERRRELRDLAEKAGAEAWLVHWPPRRGWRWIPSDAWPR